MILRQICLLARDLDRARSDWQDFLGAPVCHVDPQVAAFGLTNFLIPVANQFLEVVAPINAQAPANRFLERRGGDGGYMVICQTGTAAAQKTARDRAMADSVRIAMETVQDTHHYLQLHPADMGGSFLEVDWDERNEPRGTWAPAGDDAWMSSPGSPWAAGITAVDIAVASPQQVAGRWARILDHDVGDDGGGHWQIALANARLCFRAPATGEPEGLVGLTFARKKGAASPVLPDTTTLCGVRITVEQADG